MLPKFYPKDDAQDTFFMAKRLLTPAIFGIIVTPFKRKTNLLRFSYACMLHKINAQHEDVVFETLLIFY